MEFNLGDIFLIDMSQGDGITPKGGNDTRPKYFIVLGFDEQGNIYGGVVVNSKLNHNLPSTITDYYMPLKCNVYTFLKYDSFINCSTLKTTTRAKLLAGLKVGEILQDDYDLIIGTIKESPSESKAKLRQFGLV